tara:strand:- start:66 stop:308 length:243 start_codon:yes stop_codon:yes gene_type:complete
MTSSTISTTNNITRYNSIRDWLINFEGYNYQQLFGLKLYELEDLFYYDDPAVRYKVTGKKRDWLSVQCARLVRFFDLYEG